MPRVRLHLSVFDCGLISKWDVPQPVSDLYTRHEGRALTLELEPHQIEKLHAARRKAAKVTGYKGPVKLR